MKNSTIEVKVDERFSVEKTLRKFKRMCESYGIVKEYKKRQDYKKPSIKNKEKLEAAEKRRVKNSFRVKRNGKI
ncbi:MAG: 30S ribosomal protein S21 [Halobacteriovoraceae bacterium]|nr:30S ribosomal protein S21 [Halobacteriovoraceae bacterium]|tara:strand:- start:148 stop:369 length:222 start_codon:yes stop_codon:yes gene_type:complete